MGVHAQLIQSSNNKQLKVSKQHNGGRQNKKKGMKHSLRRCRRKTSFSFQFSDTDKKCSSRTTYKRIVV